MGQETSRERTNDLVCRAREGDRQAFGELVQIHQHLVFRVIRRTSRIDRDLAEDLAQETFLRAFRALGSFRGDCSFVSWLLRIATNLTLNQVTSVAARAERKAVSLDAPGVSADGEQKMDPADTKQPVPASRLQRGELKTVLETALGRLPEEFRSAVVLRDVEGLEYETIAEALRIPVGTVRSRLHRGREALREFITRTYGIPNLEAEIQGGQP